MESCFICNQPVLQLVGEDDFLNPVFLERETVHLLDDGWRGACHSRCICGTSKAKQWAAARMTAFIEIRHYSIVETPEAQICYHPRGLDAFIRLTRDDRCLSISTNSLHKGLSGQPSLFLDEEYNWDLQDHKGKLNAIKGAAKISLRDILEACSIEDLYSSSQLSKGYLYRTAPPS